MADAVVRLRLDASQLTAGARQAERSIERLTSRSVRLASGLAGAAANATRLANATQGIGRLGGGLAATAVPFGGTAQRRGAFGTSPTVEAAAQRGSRRGGFAAAEPGSETLRRAGFTGAGAVRGQGFTARDADLGVRTPGRTGLGVVAGAGFTMRAASREADGAADAMGRFGTAGRRAGEQAAQGSGQAAAGAQRSQRATTGAAEAMRRFGASGQRAGKQAAAGMDSAAGGAGRAGRAAGKAAGGFDEFMGAGNTRTLAIASLMSNVAGDARRLSRALGEAADRTAEATAGVQVARAELTTVVTTDHVFAGMTPEQTVAEIQRRAEQAAAGRTTSGRIVGGLGTSDFLEGAFVAASSGIFGESITVSVEQAALLGKAGQTTVRAAAIGLNQAFAIFGDKASLAGISDPVQRMKATEVEWARLSDIIARTQDTFAFTGGLKQVFDGLSRSSAVAKAYGVSLEDLAVGVGVLNDAGVTGAKAGQGMKMVIQNLPEAMRRLGLETARTADGSLNLYESLRRISESGAGPEAVTRAFGKYAALPAQTLIQAPDKIERGIGDFGGATMENAIIAADTYAERLANLGDKAGLLRERTGQGAIAVREFGVSLGSAGADVALWLTDLPLVGNALAGVAGGALQVGSTIFGAFAGISDVAVGLLSTVTLMRQFRAMSLMAGAASAFAAVKMVILSIATAAQGVAAAVASPAVLTFAAGVWAVALPIIAVVAGLALLVAGVYLVVKNWGKIKGFFRGLWDGVLGAFRGAIALITGLFERFWDWLTGLLGGGVDGPTVNGGVVEGTEMTPAEQARYGSPRGSELTPWKGPATMEPWTPDQPLGTPFFETPEVVPKTEVATPVAGTPAVPATPEVTTPETTTKPLKVVPPPEDQVPKETPRKRGIIGRLIDRVASGGQVADAGAAIPGTLADGVTAGGNELGLATEATLQQQFAPLMPSSDAERGPLANLTAWGMSIPQTIAEGVPLGAASLAEAIQAAVAVPEIAAPILTAPELVAPLLPELGVPTPERDFLPAQPNAPDGRPQQGQDAGATGGEQTAILREILMAVREQTAEQREQRRQQKLKEQRATDRRPRTATPPPPWALDYAVSTGDVDALG